MNLGERESTVTGFVTAEDVRWQSASGTQENRAFAVPAWVRVQSPVECFGGLPKRAREDLGWRFDQFHGAPLAPHDQSAPIREMVNRLDRPEGASAVRASHGVAAFERSQAGRILMRNGERQ
jgi:hypothetical protein